MEDVQNKVKRFVESLPPASAKQDGGKKEQSAPGPTDYYTEDPLSVVPQPDVKAEDYIHSGRRFPPSMDGLEWARRVIREQMGRIVEKVSIKRPQHTENVENCVGRTAQKESCRRDQACESRSLPEPLHVPRTIARKLVMQNPIRSKDVLMLNRSSYLSR